MGPASHIPFPARYHVALLLWVALTACRITDHSEEVTVNDLNFPASGYEKVDSDDLPQFTFDSTTIDMGRIVEGTKVNRSYIFKNTGGSALVITDVRGSCGCTVSKEWPRDPVPPGKSGEIHVTFDSAGRSGRQNKTVTVVANTNPPSTVLLLTGEILGPGNVKPIE